jgi:excisionase family DNA binding protein
MKRSLEERLLNLEISNLYQSVTRRLIEIYDEQKRKPEQTATSDASFDVSRAAILLGVRTGLVRRLVREGRLGYHRIGRLLRFSQQDIDDFISSQKKDAQKKLPHVIKIRSVEPRQRKDTETSTPPTREEIKDLWQSSKREIPIYGSSKETSNSSGRRPRARRKPRQSE